MESYGIFIYLTAIVAFYSSFMGGANDLANSMGTSVGSGVLNHKKAVFIAAIATFSGAMLVGQHVTATIAKGIVNPASFEMEPIKFIYGMFAALVSTGLFLNIANLFGLPVSTTHSIVGSVVGFGIIAGGIDCIKWKKIVQISLSWVGSPIIGGIFSFCIFIFLRKTILESKKPRKAAKNILPLFIIFVLTVIILSFLYKGLKNLDIKVSFLSALMLALLISSVGALVTRRRIVKQIKRKRNEFEVVDRAFRFLQVISASFVAFAYGANDVGNGIGPLAAVVNTINKHNVKMTAGIPLWVLALGAVGIVIGLSVFGYRVIETVGKKITEITPIRGFTAEFGAATTVLFASLSGLPISTTHTLVGSVIGVGLARGMEALDLRMIRRILVTWIITIPAAAIFTIIVYKIMITLF